MAKCYLTLSQVNLATKLSSSGRMMRRKHSAHNDYCAIFITMTEEIPLGKSISISRSGSYGTSGKLVCASVSEFSRFESTTASV